MKNCIVVNGFTISKLLHIHQQRPMLFVHCFCNYSYKLYCGRQPRKLFEERKKNKQWRRNNSFDSSRKMDSIILNDERNDSISISAEHYHKRLCVFMVLSYRSIFFWLEHSITLLKCKSNENFVFILYRLVSSLFFFFFFAANTTTYQIYA